MKIKISKAVTNEYCPFVDPVDLTLDEDAFIYHVLCCFVDFVGFAPKKSDIREIEILPCSERDCDGFLWLGYSCHIRIKRLSGKSFKHYIIESKSHTNMYIALSDRLIEL